MINSSIETSFKYEKPFLKSSTLFTTTVNALIKRIDIHHKNT